MTTSHTVVQVLQLVRECIEVDIALYHVVLQVVVHQIALVTMTVVEHGNIVKGILVLMTHHYVLHIV